MLRVTLSDGASHEVGRSGVSPTLFRTFATRAGADDLAEFSFLRLRAGRHLPPLTTLEEFSSQLVRIEYRAADDEWRTVYERERE